MTPILPPSVSSSSSMLAQDKFNGLQPSVTSMCGLLGEPATPSTQRWRNVLANRWNQTREQSNNGSKTDLQETFISQLTLIGQQMLRLLLAM